MKIVLIGKNGLLGSDCLQVFSQSHDLVALDIEELDITDALQVEEMVRRLAAGGGAQLRGFCQG